MIGRAGCFAAVLLASLPLSIRAQPLDAASVAAARSLGILDTKSSRSPAELKLDPALLFAHRALARGARRNAITTGVPGFVQRLIDDEVDASGFASVAISASSPQALAAWLRSVGAREVEEFAASHQVTARVPLAQLLDVAARADVTFVTPRERPLSPARVEAIAGPKRGAVTWGGVTGHRAAVVHATGITGTGVKVCVLSDGVDSLTGRQAAGELPAVDVLGGQAGAGDRGTALLEIIADMAPGATLGFATATNGPASFANNIRLLRNSLGCHVLVDDVTYPGEAAFNDDIVAQAVNEVTAAGAIYLAAAGDANNFARGNSGTFEGDFVASPDPLPPPISAIEGGQGSLHQFPSGLSYTPITPGADFTGRSNRVSLKWSDPSNQSLNDYDLYVMDATGTQILGSGIKPAGGAPNEEATCDVTQESMPAGQSSPCNLDATHTCSGSSSHLFCYFPVNARIQAVLYSGAQRAIRIDTFGGVIGAADRTDGATFGHAAAASAITVGAISLAGQGSPPLPFTAANGVDAYSSDGPRHIFYTRDVGTQAITPITPGNVKFGTGGGTSLPKVTLAAADCGATTTPGFETFCGTGAAAASAAGIAALMKSANPSTTQAQMDTKLRASAIDIGAAGTDGESGSGIVMANTGVISVLTALAYGKTFVPGTISAGGSSTLTITISNPNAVAIGGVALTDTYPPQMVNTSSPNPTVSGSGCTATLSASAGGNSFAISNATIPASTVCTFTVVVTSFVGGARNDMSGVVTTPLGMDTAGAAATLLVDAPAVQRAFVASRGTDDNTVLNCVLTTPCRTFGAAQTVLLSGGEIVALDGAGFGAVEIYKSLSIVANPGFYAGISASSGESIRIATGGVSVLLRGLTLNGIGATTGIRMTNGTNLTVDNCTVAGFTGSGVWIDAPGATVRISNSVLSANGVDGLQLSRGRADVVRSRAFGNGRAGFAAATSSSGATAILSIVDSVAFGNQWGFATVGGVVGSIARLNATRVTGTGNSASGFHVQASGGAPFALVGGSMFSQNAIGVNNVGGSLKTLGDNLVDLNGSNSSGTLTFLPGS